MESQLAAVERREAMCVLRDGTGLHTILLVPRGRGPWPALLMRHPYDVTGDEREGLVDIDRLVAAGYLVALQDVRGRFGSEGDFDPCIQEVADGADAVAWLASLPECTGSVAMWGASYASDTQFAALLGGTRELKAIAATVTPALSSLDGFRFRGGVPEIGSTLAWTHYAISPEAIARIPQADQRAAEDQRWQDTERAMTDGSAFRAGILRDERDVEATVRWGLDRLRDPLDSARHRDGKIVDRIDDVDIPVLIVGGWFDVFLGSTVELYRRLARRARDGRGPHPRLILGPWSHSNMTGVIAGVDFGPSASVDELWGDGDLTEQHLRLFDRALRGHLQDGSRPGSSNQHDPDQQDPDQRSGDFASAPVHVFVMGTNRWVAYDEFPPPSRELALFLGADGALAAEPSPGARRLISDPADPVPTHGGAVLLFGPFDAGPEDQAAIEARPDVVSWRTEPLRDELTIVGAVRAIVHLAVTGTDADVVVRLCDEHPDGRNLVVADGIQRGSARGVDPVTGVGERRPLEPGRGEEFTVDLWSTAHTFLPGHRVRVDIAPSSSPRWEVGTNAFAMDGAQPVPTSAEYTIRHGAAHPSRIILPTVSNPA